MDVMRCAESVNTGRASAMPARTLLVAMPGGD
jgi:hypothetical protein